MMESRNGIVVLRLRIEHNSRSVRGQRRAHDNIERYLRTQYGAKRLASGEHEVKIVYRTDRDLEDLMDDLLFAIAGEALMRNCFSETEARLEGTDHRW